jgi:hypothetical protein
MYASGKASWKILKLICRFVSKMILYLGSLLQCGNGSMTTMLIDDYTLIGDYCTFGIFPKCV